jgi:hypothetical protein
MHEGARCAPLDRPKIPVYGGRSWLARIGDKRGNFYMPRGKSKTSRRTVLEPRKGDRRYLRRNKRREFKKEVNIGRSLSVDRRRAAKTKVKKGQGDRGDT